MKVEDFVNVLGCDFYTGVPDSQIKSLCDYLMNIYGIDEKHHIIAANEGNCVGIAAGYNLATGKTPVIYMQNSGEGNIINPVTSLLNEKVYAIPAIFVIGWRGQPGIHDEPQHIFQGEITCELLDVVGIRYFVVKKDTSVSELNNVMNEFRNHLKLGKSVSFVIEKNALSYDKIEYKNDNSMIREEILKHIVEVTHDDPIISTTGKTSRELFEIRDNYNQGHDKDFLTVGSMGHASSIALGVAVNKPDKKIWCIDGDGSLIMHMGAMSIIGNVAPKNFVHIVINNYSHESVGGMPTVSKTMNMKEIAYSCGYNYAVSVDNFKDLDFELNKIKNMNQLCFIEILSSIGSRDDLGRPTTIPLENKMNFMNLLKK